MSRALSKDFARFRETAVDEEVVVMNLDSGDFYSLTGTARAIWDLIDGSRDREAIEAQLARQFDCGEAEIADDVSEFLERLRQAGLLVGG